MATLSIAAYGYGIRYDHGLFRQVIKDGWQQEYPENWLSFGNPWEFERPEVAYAVGFGGTVEAMEGEDDTAPGLEAGRNRRRGRLRHARSRLARTPCEHAAALVRARAATRCGSMRSTRATMSARWPMRVRSESISKVLYPSDATPAGQELRLRQEYFFVSASLQDLIRRH